MLYNVLEEPDTAVYRDVGGNRILRSVRNSLPDDTVSKSETNPNFLPLGFIPYIVRKYCYGDESEAVTKTLCLVMLMRAL